MSNVSRPRVVEITTNERINDETLKKIRKLFEKWVSNSPTPKNCILFHGENYHRPKDINGARHMVEGELDSDCPAYTVDLITVFPTIIKVPESLFWELKRILNTADVDYVVVGYWDFTPGEPPDGQD